MNVVVFKFQNYLGRDGKNQIAKRHELPRISIQKTCRTSSTKVVKNFNVGHEASLRHCLRMGDGCGNARFRGKVLSLGCAWGKLIKGGKSIMGEFVRSYLLQTEGLPLIHRKKSYYNKDS